MKILHLDTNHPTLLEQLNAAGFENHEDYTSSKIEIENNKLTVTREIDGGTNILEMNMPAVLTADLRLNEPRFVKLPNLMMARKKTIEKIKASELASDTSTKLELLEVSVPPSRKAGIKVSSVEELLEKLKDNEGIKL